MFGFIAGVVSGIIQFWMLSKFTRAVTHTSVNTKIALLGIAQFFLPLVTLLVCALLFRKELLWAGIGMTVVLLGCAIIRFISKNAKNRF